MTTRSLPSRFRAAAPVYLLVGLGMVLSGVILAVFSQSTGETTVHLESLRALRANAASLGNHLNIVERRHNQGSTDLLIAGNEAVISPDPSSRAAVSTFPLLPAMEKVPGMGPHLTELRGLVTRMQDLELEIAAWRKQHLLTHEHLVQTREGVMARSVAIRNSLLSVQGKQRLRFAQNSAAGSGIAIARASTDCLVIELMDTSAAILALLEARSLDAVTDIAANRLVPILYRLRSTIECESPSESDLERLHGLSEELATMILGQEATDLSGFVSAESFKSGLIADCVLRLSSLGHRDRLGGSVDLMEREFDGCRAAIIDLTNTAAANLRAAIQESLSASIRRCVVTVLISALIFAAFGWRVGRTIRRYADHVELVTEQLTAAKDRAGAALRETEVFRSTLDRQMIVSVASADGRIVEANDAFCAISGYSRQELVGQAHRIINSGHHPRSMWIDVWRTIAAGRSWRGDVCNRAKDGSTYWVDTVIAPFMGANGRIEKYVSIRSDITNRKRAEAELREATERYELAISGTADGVWDWNLATHEVVYAPRYRELLGYVRDDAQFPHTFESFASMLHPDDVAATNESIRLAIEEAKPYRAEYRLRTRDGSYRWFAARGTTLRDSGGRAVRMAGAITDITDRREAEQRVLSATAMLKNTGRLARVGGWELDVATGAIVWSEVVYDICEVEHGTPITLAIALGLYSPESAALVDGAIKRAIAEGVGFDLELSLNTAKGRRIHVRAMGEVVRRNGVVVSLTGAFQDISTRIRLERQTRDAEQFLRNAVDSLDSHTVVLSKGGRILSVNRAWREFALSNNGAGPSVLEGADYLAPCDRAAPRCPEAGAVARAIRAVLGGEAEPLPIQYACHSPNEKRWFQCSIRGFSCGSERFAVVSHLNITAVKQAEAELISTNAELVVARTAAEAASRAKSEFLANMSHEIRTPLTAILGFADILREDGNIANAPQSRVQTLDTIDSAGRHLLTVINDILDLSKIEANRMAVETVDTPLIQILGEVASLMRPRALTKGLTLSMNLDSPVPDHVESDPTRLRQILMNLAGNAVKFTETGSVTMTAGVRVEESRQVLTVDIADTGPGMSREQTGRLFTTFGQADGTVTRKHGGSGLGLMISRRLAKLMGGDVTLVSTEPGKGSRFRLELPLNACAGSKMVTSVAAVSLDAPARPPAARVTLKGRILLAEDGVDNQRLITFHLRKAGATIEVAENGRIALDMIERAKCEGKPYDLLLTDMQMPEMDGYTLARTLRQGGSTMPVVALTAHAMAEDRAKCLAAGCDDYASKPIDKAKLLATCAMWMGRRVGTPDSSLAA